MSTYIGLDVSLKETHICVLDQNGDIVHEGRAASDPAALRDYIQSLDMNVTLIGLEAGQLSAWLFHGLTDAGLPAVCVESRHMNAALKAQRIKTDRNDARGIAHMMRTGWYRTVHIKSTYNQKRRVLLVNRKWLVEKRGAIANQIRGTIRTFGYKLGSVSELRFEARVLELISHDKELLAFVRPMLRMRASLLAELKKLEGLLLKLIRKDPVCRRLMTIPGIGPINALAFVTAVDNPHNFSKSQSVGAFLGLTPSKYASGEVDRNGTITKCGDAMVREYLFEAAQTLLTRVKKPLAIRAWAARIAKRSSPKKAIVALARKLSVLMHRIWIDGTEFKAV